MNSINALTPCATTVTMTKAGDETLVMGPTGAAAHVKVQADGSLRVNVAAPTPVAPREPPRQSWMARAIAAVRTQTQRQQ